MITFGFVINANVQVPGAFGAVQGVIVDPSPRVEVVIYTVLLLLLLLLLPLVLLWWLVWLLLRLLLWLRGVAEMTDLPKRKRRRRTWMMYILPRDFRLEVDN